MKLYRTIKGPVLEKNGSYFLVEREWQQLINNDNIYSEIEKMPSQQTELANIIAPIGENQELWACGVTYLRSKIGRQEESRESGAADFYGRVYEAERPEVFFKSNPHRVDGPGGKVRIRKDSNWNVPEPELVLVVTSTGKIIGYTIGNDMSSRSIEGENPLYLPQAKTYDGCAALGPCILLSENNLDSNTNIHLRIHRGHATVFEGSISLSQMKRSAQELVSFVYRECSFPHGCLVMTGTGIVPGNEFSLAANDEISISIDRIGTLTNIVE